MTMSSDVSGGPVTAGARRSLIDAESRFLGNYTTPNDLQIDGQYEGTIDCAGSLVVAESADVNARVSAGAVAVVGHLQGEIGCRGRFEILPTGRVEARVVAGTIVVHEGARYEGEMRMGTEGGQPQTGAAQTRPENRSGRRPPASEPHDVPSFAGGGRSNGRSLEEAGSSGAEADRTPPSGTSAS
jgi:cytoskeletal protein CcmA (bactofilin family)